MSVVVRLEEWSVVGPTEAEVLRGVTLADAATRRLAAQLAEQNVLEITELRDGLRLRTRSHVGRLALGSLVVEVRPKIPSPDLLPLVRYAYGLRDLRLFERTDFAEGSEVLQDLLVAQLCAEASELLGRGIARRYVLREEELGSPQGRIVVGGLADGRFRHTGALPCQHHPRSSDFVLNQTVAAGLVLASGIAVDDTLRLKARRLAAGFHTGPFPRLTGALLARARRALNRLVVAYEPAVRIIELLYEDRSLGFDAAGALGASGFLFDMNRFFQALLLRFMTENLPGYEVHAEERIRKMIQFSPGANPRNRSAPQPRPDFVVRKKGKVAAILDAKYRDLWDRPLPREMLYQLSMYALSQPRPATATILYPTIEAGAVDAVLQLRDPSVGDVMGFVALRPVVLSELRAAIEGAGARHLAEGWLCPAAVT